MQATHYSIDTWPTLTQMRSAGADRGLISPTAGRTDGVSVWQLPELASGNQ